MTVSAICTTCKSTFKLGTRSCPRCHRKPLTHFKLRIKTSEGWQTKQSTNLQALLALSKEPPFREACRTPAPPSTLKASADALTLKDVWASFVPWAMTHLRSFKSYETIWRLRLLPTVGSLPLQEVTPERIYGLLEGCHDLSPASRTRIRALVSRLFTFARQRMGYRQENPVAFVAPERYDNIRRRVLTPEETERLLTVLATWPNRPAALLISFLYHSGRRRGEVRQLTWDNVDLERGVVTFPANTTKSKRTNVVPVSNEAWAILREAHARRNGSSLVFPCLTGRFAWHIEGNWQHIRKAAGLDGVRLHDLRRTWISRTLARGVGAFIVKDLVGHEHITTTQRYVNLDMRALEKAVRP
jgi:integrase